MDRQEQLIALYRQEKVRAYQIAELKWFIALCNDYIRWGSDMSDIFEEARDEAKQSVKELVKDT